MIHFIDEEFEAKQKERVIYPDPEIERDVYVPQTTPFPPELFTDANKINPFDDQKEFLELLNSLQQQNAGQPNANANSFAAFAQFGNIDGSGANPFFGNVNANDTPKVPETRLQKFLNAKVNIALLAVLTYALISIAPFHWNVFLIFLVWEIAEICILKQHESNSSGIINVFFMLAGMSPTKVNVVLKWVQLLNKVLRDVALFMFYFVFIHITRAYWSGISLVPNIDGSQKNTAATATATATDDAFEF